MITTIAIYLLLVAMIDAFASPRPRPEASLKLNSGRTVEGPLVTATSTTWYVAPQAERIEAVSVNQIDQAQVETPERERDSVLDVVGLGELDPF